MFKSTVDATVSTDAVVDRLLNRLGPSGHELVLFDINRVAAAAPMLISDPGSLTSRLLADDTLPFTLTVITNENPKSLQVTAHRKDPFAADVSETAPLGLAWPPGVISLSHVALPFPPDDPLYGQQPPDNTDAHFPGSDGDQG